MLLDDGGLEAYPTTMLPATSRFVAKQLLWLFVMQALGSMIIDAAINFGIHVALYNNSDPVHLWQLPNSIAGDLAVTLFVQNILTWIIGSTLQWTDFWGRRIPPYAVSGNGFWARSVRRAHLYYSEPGQSVVANHSQPSQLAPGTVTNGHGSKCEHFVAWFIATPDCCRAARRAVIIDETESGDDPRFANALAAAAGQRTGTGGAAMESKAAYDTQAGTAAAPQASAATPLHPEIADNIRRQMRVGRCKRVCVALGGLVLRGLAFSVPSFLIFWPITVGICAAIWGNTGYNNFPQPALIFAVYTGLLGFVAGPILGMAVMLSAARTQMVRKRQAPVV